MSKAELSLQRGAGAGAGAVAPVLVEAWRGSVVESGHRGSVVAVDRGGEVIFALGDVGRAIYPRSALKPFQAIPLLVGGGVARFNLSAREIALACASHSGEEGHVRVVGEWLARLGLGAEDLECGAELPLGRHAAHALLARGETPSRMHHNCSGKHVGMLCLARLLGEGKAAGAGAGADLRGYSEYSHAAQRAWMEALSELIGVDVFAMPWERDGCGLPAICMPLHQLAYAFAQFGRGGKAGAGVGDVKAVAMEQILGAVRAQPQMFAGSSRCCTDVIEATGGEVVVKVGAEGVYGGVIAGRGIGFALKIDDGAWRAATVALGAVLRKLGALGALGTLDGGDAQAKKLARHFAPILKNSNGKVVGKIAPTEGWEI